MSIEAQIDHEQDPERISLIRDELRNIYSLSEVTQAVIEHYMGRVDEYSAKRFRQLGEVTIKKGLFAFHFFPRIKPNQESKFSQLEMARTPLLINLTKVEHPALQKYVSDLNVNSYTIAGRMTLNASSANAIEVGRNSDWLSDLQFKIIRGEEALDLADEIIDSFINPLNQKPQTPKV